MSSVKGSVAAAAFFSPVPWPERSHGQHTERVTLPSFFYLSSEGRKAGSKRQDPTNSIWKLHSVLWQKKRTTCIFYTVETHMSIDSYGRFFWERRRMWVGLLPEPSMALLKGERGPGMVLHLGNWCLPTTHTQAVTLFCVPHNHCGEKGMSLHEALVKSPSSLEEQEWRGKLLNGGSQTGSPTTASSALPLAALEGGQRRRRGGTRAQSYNQHSRCRTQQQQQLLSLVVLLQMVAPAFIQHYILTPRNLTGASWQRNKMAATFAPHSFLHLFAFIYKRMEWETKTTGSFWPSHVHRWGHIKGTWLWKRGCPDVCKLTGALVGVWFSTSSFLF